MSISLSPIAHQGVKAQYFICRLINRCNSIVGWEYFPCFPCYSVSIALDLGTLFQFYITGTYIYIIHITRLYSTLQGKLQFSRKLSPEFREKVKFPLTSIILLNEKKISLFFSIFLAYDPRSLSSKANSNKNSNFPCCLFAFNKSPYFSLRNTYLKSGWQNIKRYIKIH